MTWLFESPWPFLLTGLVIEAILIVALVRTSRGAIGWAIAGVGLLTVGLVVLERFIVTDDELIRETLHGAAAAVSANDLNGVLAYISPEAVELRNRANETFRRTKFHDAKIGNDLTITTNYQGAAPSALATFTGRFRAELPREPIGHDLFVFRFSAGLVKQGDKWLVFAVERRDLTQH